MSRRRSGRRLVEILLLAVVAQACPAQASEASANVSPGVPPRPLLRIDAGSDAAFLTPREQESGKGLVEAVARRLPPTWRESLDPELVLEWRDDLPERVHGRAIGNRVLLRRELLAGWMSRGGEGAEDPDGRAALAALIHELAHVHDRSLQGGLSRDPRLLDLAGWQLQPLAFGARNPVNPFTDRSPDRYELESPAEFVAVNLEYFLLDPQYACRRPALFRHFAAHFRWSPPRAECEAGQAFLLADPNFARAGLARIDAARVHAVDYLLAESDDAIMSRWGHGMLRLVICAPGREPGPDCRLDLTHHRVLSFRAFVGDVQISSWRGLTGSYPSRLFVLPLEQVVDEYTKIELRGLRSIPLRLRRNEIAALLERAARVHWSYDGRYYFVGNNCAVETWRLLHDGVSRLAAENLRSVTPTGLLRRLRRAGIADTSVLEDRAEASRLGFYFEPASARYQAMYEVARDALQLPQPRVEEWLALAPRQRAPWLANADPGSSPGQALRSSAALLLLEEAAQRRQELLARDAIKRRLSGRGGGRKDAAATAAIGRLRKLLAREALLIRPGALRAEGYGLPQQERAVLDARAAGLAREVGSGWRDLHRVAREALPAEQQAAMRGIETNLATLGQRLRSLHQAQGGLRLDVP